MEIYNSDNGIEFTNNQLEYEWHFSWDIRANH